MRRGGGNKYHARRTGGNASRKEARREAELRLLERAGQITGLQTQVPFELIPAQYGPDETGPRGGKRRGTCLERSCVYVADFVYRDKTGAQIVEDSKGFRTKDYIIKRKLMLYRYGIRIKET